MRLPSRINDRLARLIGFWYAALSKALRGGARLRRVARGKGSVLQLARVAGAAAIAAGVLIGLEGCRTKPQLAQSDEITPSGAYSDVPQAGTSTNQQKLAETLHGSDPRAGSPPGTSTNQQKGAVSETIILREGDTVRISFPGSPSLNSVQQIRRDGKVSLALVGEFQAAGLTPVQMEKALVKLYAPQLVSKEVTVTLESSAFVIYVTGAVGRSGKLVSDRPLTALEAVIDAGVDYSKANLKSVTVIRRVNGREERHTLNLKKELMGGGGEPFYLKPEDIIFVRERFTWL